MDDPGQAMSLLGCAFTSLCLFLCLHTQGCVGFSHPQGHLRNGSTGGPRTHP